MIYNEDVAKPNFRKEIRKCPSHIRKKTGEVISALEAVENLRDSGLDYIKCKGGRKDKNYYRIRVWDWRIGIELIYPKIIAITILFRGQMYKKFPLQ